MRAKNQVSQYFEFPIIYRHITLVAFCRKSQNYIILGQSGKMEASNREILIEKVLSNSTLTKNLIKISSIRYFELYKKYNNDIINFYKILIYYIYFLINLKFLSNLKMIDQ